MRNRLLGSVLMSTMLLMNMACEKKANPAEPNDKDKGSVAIQVKNVVGDAPLNLHSTVYKNAHGDSFTVRVYKYYLSNFKLVHEDGSEYVQPESYYLLDQEDESSLRFTLDNVPSGKYTHIKFLQGVDSLRNVSGVQEGALNPEHGMFWTWTTGYIMAKFEGTSNSVPTSSGNFIYHLGGFTTWAGAVRSVELPLPSPIIVDKQKNTTIHLTSDILKWFSAVHVIDLESIYNIMEPGLSAKNLVENYSHMMSVDKVTNE
jgi:hypothetical protein